MRIWLRRKTQKGYGSQDENGPVRQQDLKLYYWRTHHGVEVDLLV
jgi:hypothetical protein